MEAHQPACDLPLLVSRDRRFVDIGDDVIASSTAFKSNSRDLILGEKLLFDYRVSPFCG
jgi:hypothetical protein